MTKAAVAVEPIGADAGLAARGGKDKLLSADRGRSYHIDAGHIGAGGISARGQRAEAAVTGAQIGCKARLTCPCGHHNVAPGASGGQQAETIPGKAAVIVVKRIAARQRACPLKKGGQREGAVVARSSAAL